MSDRAHVVARTYDKVDLSDAKAVTIGINETGVYAIRDEQDQRVAIPIHADGRGPTVSNLLHAFVHAEFPRAGTYRHEAGDAFTPDTSARKSVTKLLDQLQTFMSTDFIVLQEGLLEKSRELEARRGEARAAH